MTGGAHGPERTDAPPGSRDADTRCPAVILLHMAGTHRSRLTRRILPWTIPLCTLVLATIVTGCSRDEAASTTTTTTTTTTSPPTTTTAPGADTPLPVAWVRQVGGPGDDVINAATGHDDVVIGAGTTTGLSAVDRPSSAPTAAFLDVVAAVDGTPRSTTQSHQTDTATATGITSAPSGTTTSSQTMTTCGSTAAPIGAPSVGSGGTDAWCAPVSPDATLGVATRYGSDADDSFAGVTMTADGQDVYAVGQAVGLFAGAREPTGGQLGAGDALVTRITSTGELRWARQFGSAAPDAATGVTTSKDGDAVVTGWTDGRTRGDTSGDVGGRDAWIARMDQSGGQRWMTQYGTTGSDRALAVASGGDPRRGTETFIAAGATDGAAGTATNLGGTDAMVNAFDASGRMRWSVQLGSAADDEASGVAVDGDTVYVVGTTAGEIVGGTRISLTPTARPDSGDRTSGPSPTTTTPPTTTPPNTLPPTGGGLDGFLAAIDLATGELRWVAQFGSTGDERVTGLTRTGTGLLVASGSTTGQMGTTAPSGGTDGFMVAFVPPAGGGGAASIV